MKKILLLTFLLIMSGCTQPSVQRAPLPTDDLLVIAHRGASAYAPDHTLAAYELAVQMGSDYIELDLQLTKDGKLVAFHDTVVSFPTVDRAIMDITFDELKLYTLGEEFNAENPKYASVAYEDLRVIGLDEIIRHFGHTVNYYIEIKSPSSYPGIETELLRQLRAHGLLSSENDMPKVVIQSFDADSLKKVFDREPTIPLIKLYTFNKTAHLSKKELRDLSNYASGIGIDGKTVTKKFVDAMHKEGLDVHAFTVNDEEMMRTLMIHGVDGIFTDNPDIAVRLRDEKSSMDAN
ncbi:glycerophosphodiester phosphodiesterase family protein [Sporosarcina sp. FSL K6-3457]|uniref:glycerophosphodiester phosphodiesterase family protein n=1 Tax=Sporosarcina sp. FSL K6-3457 TaxID=2978204 RepID=UPI0030F9416B